MRPIPIGLKGACYDAPTIHQGASNNAGLTLRDSANLRKKPPSGELLLHTRAMVRLGAGDANGRSAMVSVDGMGGLTDSTGIRVTPALAATI